MYHFAAREPRALLLQGLPTLASARLIQGRFQYVIGPGLRTVVTREDDHYVIWLINVPETHLTSQQLRDQALGALCQWLASHPYDPGG